MERRQRSPLDGRGRSGPGPGGINWLGRLTLALPVRGSGMVSSGLLVGEPLRRIIHCRIFASRGLDRSPRPSSTSRISGVVHRHGPIPRRRRTREASPELALATAAVRDIRAMSSGLERRADGKRSCRRPVRIARPTKPGETICLALHIIRRTPNGWRRGSRSREGHRARTSSRATSASAVEFDVAVRPVRGSELSRGSPPGAISSAWARRLHRTAARVYRCECKIRKEPHDVHLDFPPTVSGELCIGRLQRCSVHW